MNARQWVTLAVLLVLMATAVAGLLRTRERAPVAAGGGSAGGDPQARIQRLKAAYEAAQKEPRPAPAPAAGATDSQPDSLLARFRAWAGQRSKLSQLSQAMRESLERAK